MGNAIKSKEQAEAQPSTGGEEWVIKTGVSVRTSSDGRCGSNRPWVRPLVLLPPKTQGEWIAIFA